MKRSNFIKSLVGLVAAPSIIAKATEEQKFKGVFELPNVTPTKIEGCTWTPDGKPPFKITGVQTNKYKEYWDEAWEKLLHFGDLKRKMEWNPNGPVYRNHQEPFMKFK